MSDLSAWEQAAEHVTRGDAPHLRERVSRVIRDRRMVGDRRERGALHEIDAALSHYPARSEWTWRHELLFIIHAGGGWQPTETEATRAKRRRKMAELARELAETMAADSGCDHFTLEELWALSIGIEPTQVVYERRKPQTAMPAISGNERPSVSGALVAFAGAIDRDIAGDEVPLSHFDRRPSWAPLAAQPGRKEAPQALLERALCQWFERYTDSHHPDLVAKLVEVALNAEVDPADLSRRWRKFTERT